MTQQKDHFSALPDERKAELFFEAVGIVCELIEGGELHTLLHNNFELSNEDIRNHRLLPDAELMSMGMAIDTPFDKNIKLWQVLRKADFAQPVNVTLDGSSTNVSIEKMADLMDQRDEDFSEILDTHVCKSRMGENYTEIVIEGVALDVIERFCQECESLKGQELEPTM